MNLVIVSGRSGSGKSVALRALEDLGYYCVDNLPVSLIGTLIHQLKPSYESVAISVDIRNLKDQIRELESQLAALSQEVKLTSFYLHSNDTVLLKRYSETRRLHPLSQLQSSLPEALKLEGELLEPFAKQVDHYIDTSTLNIYELSDRVREILLGYAEKELVITFESFGFKHGMPEQADFMFDVRFLPNPHWEEGLRTLTGLDQPVQEFFGKHPMVSKLIWQVENMMSTWLPYLERNNRSYLTIAIGCTGGQHRSVFVAEQLALYFKDSRHTIKTHHRELARAS